MTFLKINNVDFSSYCSELAVKSEKVFTSQTNAAGDSTIDYIASKKQLSIEVIALDAETESLLLSAIGEFEANVDYLDPETGQNAKMHGIIEGVETKYYTIQDGKIHFQSFSFEVKEL